jgi:uncharacterized repeat protein (TIGR01451 family)
MKSFLNQYKRAGLACVALGAIAVSQQAFALGTPSSTSITNTATVNYQVSGVPQTAVNSNTAAFVVDNKVDHTVTESSGGETTVGTGAPNVVTTFKLTNTGNTAQGYILGAANNTGGSLFTRTDNDDMDNLRYFVSTAACSVASATPTYASATDTATQVNTLAADACVYVHIVADTPIDAVNGAVANVRLSATAAIAIPPGPGALVAQLENPGDADAAATVDVVFADTGVNVNRLVFADDQYFVQSAALSVAKTSTVISDPFSSSNPKAVPGATVEYAIALTNSGAVSATVVTITDPIPVNTTFATGTYNAGVSSVSITVGLAPPTFCVAEAGSDTNGDGCFRTAGGVLTVGSPALATVASGGTAVTVRFRVTIN